MSIKFKRYKLEDGLIVEFKNEKIILKDNGEDFFLYQRIKNNKIVASTIFSSKKGKVELAILPIRPIQMPKQVAHHIMVKLESPIAIPPNSKTIHYLTMPIEIGIFTICKNIHYMIDAFSLSLPKYGLYGTPDLGYICRFHISSISSKENAKQYEEAVILMKFKNNSPTWVTVSKIVMDAYLVDLYIKNDIVYLEDSNLLIENENEAFVFLNNKPPLSDLEEVPVAAENVKKFRIGIIERSGFGVQGKTCMEYGY